jgi:erythromycin esterase-like protein
MRFSGFQPAETSRSLFRFDIASAAFSFRRPNLLLRIVSLSICMGVAFLPAAGQSAGPAAQIKDTEPVVHVLCGKSVALLGESPVHGFGKTLEFKVGLVRRLIDECHYNAFFIESGIYDFLNIQKRLNSGQEVTEPMISAAIGGLWATHEVQPLILFLLDRAKAGRVILGGLDDQLQRKPTHNVKWHPTSWNIYRARATRKRDALQFSKGTPCGSTLTIARTVPKTKPWF